MVEACGRHLGDIWIRGELEAPGGIREASGRQLGGIWEASLGRLWAVLEHLGRHLWEASGPPLGRPGASWDPDHKKHSKDNFSGFHFGHIFSHLFKCLVYVVQIRFRNVNSNVSITFVKHVSTECRLKPFCKCVL